MRESCSCGAGIISLNYKRVLKWRHTHKHTAADPDQELDDMFAYGIIFAADEKEEE
jgi:hypothetical protein